MLPFGLLNQWLGITEDADEDIAEDAADRALTWIETQTGRYFREPREFEVRVRAGLERYWLPEIPLLVTVESEEVYQIAVHEKNGTEWTEILPEDYELVPPDMGRLYEMPTLEFANWADRTCLPRGGKNLRFTFTAGYVVGDLPGDIQQMLLDMVGAWWEDRKHGSGGLKSESIDGYSYELWLNGDGSRFTDEWRASLTKWKHPVLGRS